jgi:hypothetical protein
MECEHTHNAEESTAQTQGGIIMKINLSDHEKASRFRSLQFDFEGQPAEKDYSRNEVMKHISI